MEEPSSEPKETKPANLVMLKTAASSLRDSIVQVNLTIINIVINVFINIVINIVINVVINIVMNIVMNIIIIIVLMLKTATRPRYNLIIYG